MNIIGFLLCFLWHDGVYTYGKIGLVYNQIIQRY